MGPSARKEFGQDDGTWSRGTQCAQAAAISAGFVTPDLREKSAQKLVTSIETNKCLLTCGILGVKWLFRALSETGHGDLAIKMLRQTERPSFGDWLANGATTAWESWKGAASQNHIMFGDVSAWLMQYPGGIRLVEPGFRKFLLVPDIAGLDWVKVAHECPYGTIRSEWRKEGGRFTWLVEVPPNTTARVVLPDGLKDAVAPVGAREAGRASWLVGSGVWRWEAVADKRH